MEKYLVIKKIPIFNPKILSVFIEIEHSDETLIEYFNLQTYTLTSNIKNFEVNGSLRKVITSNLDLI
jgi:hypothetical protein